MRLYRTANGAWAGTEADARNATRAEGSKPGSWRKVEVPTDKTGLLAFLNHAQVALVLGPDMTTASTVAAKPTGGGRFRVYVGGLFAAVVHADNDDGARDAAIAALEVRRVTAQ